MLADLSDGNHEGNIDVNTGTAEALQLDALSPATKTVTFTVGGNDWCSRPLSAVRDRSNPGTLVSVAMEKSPLMAGCRSPLVAE